MKRKKSEINFIISLFFYCCIIKPPDSLWLVLGLPMDGKTIE